MAARSRQTGWIVFYRAQVGALEHTEGAEATTNARKLRYVVDATFTREREPKNASLRSFEIGNALNAKNLYTIEAHRKSHNIAYETARGDLAALANIGWLEMRKVGKAFIFSGRPDLSSRIKAYRKEKTGILKS